MALPEKLALLQGQSSGFATNRAFTGFRRMAFNNLPVMLLVSDIPIPVLAAKDTRSRDSHPSTKGANLQRRMLLPCVYNFGNSPFAHRMNECMHVIRHHDPGQAADTAPYHDRGATFRRSLRTADHAKNTHRSWRRSRRPVCGG